MKSVLISIHPKWCELIANGKKILEVRKTRPNIKKPFKCYIYCTKDKHGWFDFLKKARLDGKIIGEFVCKSTLPISITYSDPKNKIALREFPYTCMTDKEIMDYLGNGKQGWCWHISNLVIYDNPKELNEFITICPEWEKEYFDSKCLRCKYYFTNCADMRNECTVEGEKPITRPPQSWCYVERRED